MHILIFTFLCYFDAGIVFVAREADKQINEVVLSSPHTEHPVLRLSAGLVMMLLWPVFLLSEIVVPHQSPMAIKIEDRGN